MASTEPRRKVIHVAVGDDGYTARSLVKWSIKNFPQKSLRLTHVFSPQKTSGIFLRRSPTAARIESRRESAHLLLDQCIAICTEAGVEADKLYIEDESVADGLLKLMKANSLRWLVIGAAASQKYKPGMRSIASGKALHVFEFAPRTCKIWFVCNGELIHIRQATVGADDRSLPATSDSSPPNEDVEVDDIDAEFYYNCLQHDADPPRNGSFSEYLNEVKEQAANCENDLFDLQKQLGNAEIKASAAFNKAKELEELHLKEVKERKELEEAQMRERENYEKVTKERELRLEERIRELEAERDELRRNPSVLTFSESEIRNATSNFDPSRKIGEGGFGIIYKGELHKTEVAVKVLRESSSQGSAEYNQEVKALQMMRHRNIITLIGVCPEKKALIYEYLPNGSLEDNLSPKNRNSRLSWRTRIRIAMEICSALVFLHNNKKNCVVHGDVKPANVLIDANMVAKLSDFGICRFLRHSGDSGDSVTRTITTPAGSFPYMDPEFLQKGVLTPKSDVHSFGWVLLRLLTGIGATSVKDAVEAALKKGDLERVLDSQAGKWPIECALKVVVLAKLCTQESPDDRPHMSHVWKVLHTLIDTFVDSFVS